MPIYIRIGVLYDMNKYALYYLYTYSMYCAQYIYAKLYLAKYTVHTLLVHYTLYTLYYTHTLTIFSGRLFGSGTMTCAGCPCG